MAREEAAPDALEEARGRKDYTERGEADVELEKVPVAAGAAGEQRFQAPEAVDQLQAYAEPRGQKLAQALEDQAERSGVKKTEEAWDRLYHAVTE